MSILEEFAARFRNWTRWCLQKGLYQARVGSAEGAYSGPQGNAHPTGWGDWEDEAPPPSEPRVMIDLPDAILVNRAYVRLAMLSPRSAKIIKVLTFRSHWKPQWQAQKLGMHYTELDDALVRTKKMLQNVLTTL